MKKLILVYFIIFFSSLIYADNDYDHIYLEEQNLSNRVGFKYNYKENLTSNIPVKEQQFSIYGEYQILSFYSVYLKIPYTIRWSEGSENRKYIDHIRIDNKFLINSNSLKYTFGLGIELPRNHNKAGDVAKNIGYLEPYVGVMYKFNPFLMKFSVRWNTQTNTKFKEQYGEQFQRKWVYNLSFGYIPSDSSWKFWLEAQYQYIYDPVENKKKLYVIGPSLSYSFSKFDVAIIYLFPSKENQYNKQLILQLQQKF